MFLINWLESNIAMAFTSLVLIGIPVVILLIAFGKKPSKPNDSEAKPE